MRLEHESSTLRSIVTLDLVSMVSGRKEMRSRFPLADRLSVKALIG